GRPSRVSRPARTSAMPPRPTNSPTSYRSPSGLIFASLSVMSSSLPKGGWCSSQDRLHHGAGDRAAQAAAGDVVRVLGGFDQHGHGDLGVAGGGETDVPGIGGSVG